MLKIDDFLFIKAEKRYEEQMKKLWRECFPEDGEGNFIPFYFNNCYEPDKTYLAVYEDRVCSMVYTPLMKYHLGGVDFDVAYVQGLATDPEFRKLGLANELLAEALNDLNLQGVPFGILRPFKVSFYEKSGWQVFAKLSPYPFSEIKIPSYYKEDFYNKDKNAAIPEQIKQKKETGSFIERIKKIFAGKKAQQKVGGEKTTIGLEKDVCHVSDIQEEKSVFLVSEIKNYKQYINDFSAVFEYWQKMMGNAYALRNSRQWELLLEDHFDDGGRIFAVFVQDKMLAYALYLEEKEQIIIREMAVINEDSFYRLAVFLQEYTKKVYTKDGEGKNILKEVKIFLPEKSPLSQPDGGNNFAMLRVINCETLLSAFDFNLAEDEFVFLEITDDMIKNNNGYFWLEKHEFGSDCKKVNKDYYGDKFLRKFDINQLTEVLAKWYNFDCVKEEKCIKPYEKNIGGTYFNEYF